MLENEDFKIDYKSAEWKRLHPSESQFTKQAHGIVDEEEQEEKQKSFINREYIKKREMKSHVKSKPKINKKKPIKKHSNKSIKRNFGFKL